MMFGALFDLLFGMPGAFLPREEPVFDTFNFFGCDFRHKRKALSVVWTVWHAHRVTVGGSIMLQLTDEQQCTLSVAFKTKKGHDAKVDGTPTWSVSNPAVLGLAVGADGLSATVTAAGLGDCQVSMSADADLGPGVRPITGTLDVTVVAAEADTAEIVAGTPDVQP